MMVYVPLYILLVIVAIWALTEIFKTLLYVITHPVLALYRLILMGSTLLRTVLAVAVVVGALGYWYWK